MYGGRGAGGKGRPKRFAPPPPPGVRPECGGRQHGGTSWLILCCFRARPPVRQTRCRCAPWGRWSCSIGRPRVVKLSMGAVAHTAQLKTTWPGGLSIEALTVWGALHYFLPPVVLCSVPPVVHGAVTSVVLYYALPLWAVLCCALPVPAVVPSLWLRFCNTCWMRTVVLCPVHCAPCRLCLRCLGVCLPCLAHPATPGTAGGGGGVSYHGGGVPCTLTLATRPSSPRRAHRDH